MYNFIMKTNTLTITINKPLSEVFQFCITPPKAKLWIQDISNETTNEYPIKIGTIYTEFKTNNTFFKLIVADFKKNNYIVWKTENGNYQVKYLFVTVDENATKLTYIESGEIDIPFTQATLKKLKKVIENE